MHGVMVTRRVPLVDIDLGRYKRVANRRRGSKPLAVLFHLYFLCNNNGPYNERSDIYVGTKDDICKN
jgi:hypothetical protein